MNKLATAAAIAALTIAALTGCGTAASTTTTAAPVDAPAATAPPAADAPFIAYVRAHTTTLSASTDDSLDGMGHATCAALDSGSKPVDLVQAIMDTETDPAKRTDLETVTGAGVGDFCPSHLTEIQTAMK